MIENQTYACKYCTLKFETWNELGTHNCKNVAVNQQYLNDHYHASLCDINVYNCKTCDVTLNTSSDFINHRRNVCIDREALTCVQLYCWCFVCNTRFGSLEDLAAHRLATTEQAMAMMNLPKIEVLKKKNTNRDRFRSTKPRPHLCKICGKTYTQASHLKQHISYHLGEQRFECTFKGCTRKFTIRPDLNDHIRKFHTRERPYHCLVCDKRFLTGSVFYQHRLIHRGDRRYPCDVCNKRFFRSDALKYHKLIHTAEKPFKCEVCNKCFRQQGDRWKHLRSKTHNRAILRSILSNKASNEEVIQEAQ